MKTCAVDVLGRNRRETLFGLASALPSLSYRFRKPSADPNPVRHKMVLILESRARSGKLLLTLSFRVHPFVVRKEFSNAPETEGSGGAGRTRVRPARHGFGFKLCVFPGDANGAGPAIPSFPSDVVKFQLKRAHPGPVRTANDLRHPSPEIGHRAFPVIADRAGATVRRFKSRSANSLVDGGSFAPSGLSPRRCRIFHFVGRSFARFDFRQFRKLPPNRTD